MTRLEPLGGVVLAGGYAERFGGEKALASVHGTPVIRRVVDRLCGVTDEIIVACRSEQVTAL